MKKTGMNLSRKHFTLVELLIVMAIIAVLAGLSLAVVPYAQRKNAETKTLANIKTLEQAMEQFKVKHGRYPFIPVTSTEETALGGFVPFRIIDPDDSSATTEDKEFCKFFEFEKIVKGLPKENINSYQCYTVKDAWGNPLYFRSPGKTNRSTCDFGSFGYNEMPGDETKGTTISATMMNNQFGTDDDITNFKK